MSKIEEWHEHRTKIPQGQYLLKCIKAGREDIWHQGGSEWKKSEKIVLWFEILSGEYIGAIVPAFLALKGDKITQGSKYFQFWVIANGLHRPLRNRLKEMPSSMFVGKIFEGEVVDAKPRWPKGVEQPEFFHYSRVDSLYRLVDESHISAQFCEKGTQIEENTHTSQGKEQIDGLVSSLSRNFSIRPRNVEKRRRELKKQAKFLLKKEQLK